jgi:hypothetical protein
MAELRLAGRDLNPGLSVPRLASESKLDGTLWRHVMTQECKAHWIFILSYD